MIIVNRFIKMSHYFSYAKTMNLKEFVYLLIKNVINFHDVFKRIISDKKSLYIFHF